MVEVTGLYSHAGLLLCAARPSSTTNKKDRPEKAALNFDF